MNLLVVYRALNWKMDCMRSVVCVLYLSIKAKELELKALLDSGEAVAACPEVLGGCIDDRNK